jgi:hypothetical protein
MSDTEDTDLSEVDNIDLSNNLFQIDVDWTVQVETTFVQWTCDRITYGVPVPLLITMRVALAIEHFTGSTNDRQLSKCHRFCLLRVLQEVYAHNVFGCAPCRLVVVTADHPDPTLSVGGFHATLQYFFVEFSDSED